MLKNYQPHFLLLLALTFLTVGSASAQLSEFRFGIQASPTFSSMSTNDNFINRDGSNLGLKLGLVGEYYIQENYSIHTGISLHFNAGGTLFYETQYERVDIWRESLDRALPAVPDSISGGLAYKYDLSFLEIPFGLTLRTREFGYLRYWARPALYLGISTGSNGSIENAGFIDSEESFDISKEVNPFNLGWGIGAGVEYSVSESTTIFGGLTYQSGFADLTTDNDTQVRRTGRNAREDDSRGRLSSIVINLGVMF